LSNDQIQNPEEEAAQVTAAPSTEKTTKSSKKAATTSDHEDFDWDADEAGFQTYNSDEKKKLEDAYMQSFNPVAEKQVVKGRVVAINEKDVVVNIGFKSDGMVSRQEFRDMPDLAVGDEIEVFVDIAKTVWVNWYSAAVKLCRKLPGIKLLKPIIPTQWLPVMFAPAPKVV